LILVPNAGHGLPGGDPKDVMAAYDSALSFVDRYVATPGYRDPNEKQMVRQEHVLSVFLASPSDVTDERTRVEEVIDELNITWSRDLGVRLELVRWETHAHPGFAADAQAVINKQLSNDFDIFIGVMWCRFGTPTTHAGSGTVEEFQRAKIRHDADPRSVALMVYFKDQAIPPSKMDLDQLGAVLKFRDSLGRGGGLYWTFRDTGEFEQLIRLHLTRCIQEWRSRQAALINNYLAKNGLPVRTGAHSQKLTVRTSAS